MVPGRGAPRTMRAGFQMILVEYISYVYILGFRYIYISCGAMLSLSLAVAHQLSTPLPEHECMVMLHVPD